ncbi:MAG: AhpC/TSA family protein [Bacteroides sp.]|nr:AhpC/TSA family protein [Bacteroides sp.]
MRKRLGGLAALSALLLGSCGHSPKLEISLPEKFEGQTVELVNFLDSTVIASGTVENGLVEIVRPDSAPVFASVVIDGRTRAFYIVEPGKASLNDSISSATGTPLNDEFSRLMERLDSVDSLDDMGLYLNFVADTYNATKENPIGSYFGIEFMKYADLAQIDSLLAEASPEFAEAPKTRYYRNFAELRDATAPGKHYIDFEGETAEGRPAKFSQYVNNKGFTLVDFWASWCPYCIKELPELAALNEKYRDKGVSVVGVAVRDVPDDSKAAVKKHDITWPVIYNTQRRPYDIYGFSGIPHHILLDPEGNIVSRGESLRQIDARLEELTGATATH